jgi:hypothetical protein
MPPNTPRRHRTFSGFGALAMVIAVAGCTHDGVGPRAAESASTTPPSVPPAARTTSSEAFGWINGRCVPSTLAGSPQRPPPPLVARSGSDKWYGVDDLWAVVDPDNVAARQPDGRAGMKVGWWRLRHGQLRIRAERLDGRGTAEAHIPDGYGPDGFQSSGVYFSANGCWRVIGTLGDTAVSFVVIVAADGG